MRLATGYRLSQMLHVAAKLAIADVLADGPKTRDELAGLTGTHATSLHRALPALAGAGVFAQDGDGRFSLNARAELLRSHVPGSVRGYAILQGEDRVWNAWGQALHAVRTGEPRSITSMEWTSPIWEVIPKRPPPSMPACPGARRRPTSQW